MPALILTTIIGMACFLSSLSGSGTVYLWLVSASGLAGFIAWLGIAFSHYKFRKAFLAQGHSLDELKYKAKWFPFGPIFALVLCVVVIAGQGLWAMSGDEIDWLGIGVSYIGIPLFIVLYLGYKFTKKTKMVKPEEADLTKGYAKVD